MKQKVKLVLIYLFKNITCFIRKNILVTSFLAYYCVTDLFLVLSIKLSMTTSNHDYNLYFAIHKVISLVQCLI